MTPGSLHPVTPLFLPLRKSCPRGRHQSASLFLSTWSINTYNLSGEGSEISDRLPSVIPDGPPSVIPDVFNRESRIFPMQGHTKEGTKKKETGFPLKTCGNDRRSRREWQKGPRGHNENIHDQRE